MIVPPAAVTTIPKWSNIGLYIRAVDLYSFFADPDLAVFLLNADPDPALKMCTVTNYLMKSLL